MFDFVFHSCTDDEKLPPVAASVSAVQHAGPPPKPALHTVFLDRLQELNTSRYEHLDDACVMSFFLMHLLVLIVDREHVEPCSLS